MSLWSFTAALTSGQFQSENLGGSLRTKGGDDITLWGLVLVFLCSASVKLTVVCPGDVKFLEFELHVNQC